PDTPTIELEPDQNNHTLYISVAGETSTNITVSVNGKQTEPKTMGHSPQRLPIVQGWEAGKHYSVSATLSDKAGNISAASSSKNWTAPIEQQNTIIPEPEIGIGSGSNEPISIPDPPNIPTCNITIHENKLCYQIKTCTVPAPILAHISNKGNFGSNIYWFDALGSTQTRIKIHFDHIRCKPRSFWDPRTWLFCIDEHYKNSEREVRMRNKLIPKINGMSQQPAVYRQSINNQGQFTLENYSFKPVENKSLSVKNIQQGYVKAGEMWVDIKVSSKYSKSATIPQNNNPDSTGKYFSFMFGHYIGVTQWHGYTAYQSPHKGIDFGAVKKSIRAPADGYIRSIGWDSYYGDCLSGGNYVRIEHDNGMHSVYMHLESYTKTNGHTWSNGERIARGQQVGISGNTGAWNCQPLGHHLHFEVRKDSSQASHVDPVPYINVDWNKIPTLGWTQYPGRLTGDNPHPNF
ncbi:MAG: M23 family metallopeptidase, partial [Patescibacteria group bacterium]|nr:M23 family metallopeptidase [Patescibacteria group bacterium]